MKTDQNKNGELVKGERLDRQTRGRTDLQQEQRDDHQGVRRRAAPEFADERKEAEREGERHQRAVLEDEAKPAVLDAVFDAERLLQRGESGRIGAEQNVLERECVEQLKDDDARLRRSPVVG